MKKRYIKLIHFYVENLIYVEFCSFVCFLPSYFSRPTHIKNQYFQNESEKKLTTTKLAILFVIVVHFVEIFPFSFSCICNSKFSSLNSQKKDRIVVRMIRPHHHHHHHHYSIIIIIHWNEKNLHICLFV